MENQETPFKAGLNAGVIVGILSVVITFVVYFISPVGLASGKFQFGMLFLFIALGNLLWDPIQKIYRWIYGFRPCI
jgi:ABC-type multidrug transport system fused ATPase/permease subunit